MDKNLLLAVSLSILVYAAWFGFIEKRVVKQAPPKPVAASAPVSTSPAPAEAPKPSAMASSAAPKSPEKDAVESFKFAKADVSIRAKGAAIVSWKYHGPRGVVELIVQQQPGFLATFPELTFRRQPGDKLVYMASQGPLRITKEFVPDGQDMLPRVRVSINNAGGQAVQTPAWTISVGAGLGTIPTEEKENESVMRSLGLTKGEGGLNGKLEVFKPGDQPASYRWLGVDNRYFLAALLPVPGDFAKAASFQTHAVELTAKPETLAPGQSRTWDIPFYLGAKGHTWLSRYKAGLERSIDFGFFSQLGRFVLKVLDKIHAVTGNWGWSVILLTLMIQLAMFPLTYKSLKATSAMRRLQPEIARLQQRYSKEPAKLNTEMMALYKQHGANPLGGCLPMVVQMPVFIALYNALRNAWELHGASWIFWINDLSAKDPYYVLPLVMGALMYLQNKLSPAAGVDPTQQQMMKFMPIIFTVMFMNFPSGLVLYWLTNSLVSTLQQLALRKHLG
jgi:YidC/Oxa1 family membrane protein insertase